MNEFSKMLALIGLIFTCSISSTLAQEETCIGFEDLEDGAVIGAESGLMPGDELFSENGVNVTLESFHYFNGNVDFLNVFVSNDPFLNFSGEGLYVFPSNINLVFDFDQLPTIVTAVCFDFADGGGVENLAVNGEQVIVLEDFGDAPTEIAPGVSLELLIDPNSNSPTGTVCLSGEIHSLLVGGQELAIDNVCFATLPFPCNLFDLEAGFIGCDDAGHYGIEVGVQSMDDINMEVEVFVEQESYGTFGLVDFPLALEGIPPIDDAEVLLVKVCEVQSDEPCCVTTEVLIEACDDDSRCIGFEDMHETVYGGTEGNEPGEVIYTESDIPLSLFEFQNFDWTTSFHQLQVLHSDDFTEFSTAMGQYIRLDGISAIFNFSNQPGPVEMVMLDFYYDFGPINVSANGASITTLAVLTDGFINIGPGVNMEISFSEDDPMIGTITFTGNIYTLLIGGNALRIDNVCADPTCTIENLEISASDCDDNNQFNINLDFDYTLVSDTFALWLNGNEASFHDYNDLPLTLGPFTGPVDEELVFEVKDRENPDCRATATLSPVNCHVECDIRDMVAAQTDCHNNGGFDIILDFIHENTSEHFDLFVNGELWEDYAYDMLPIHFGPFFENEAIHLLVKDASGTCAEDLLFEAQACFDQCTFTEVFAEAHDCNNDGYFFVDIEFNAHNPGPLGYYVFGDGQIFGPFNYDETFVTVGPFEGDGSSIYDFLLLDIANPACFGYYELGPISCNNQQCEIFELVVDPLECNDDGTYQLYIHFEVEHPGNDFFDVLNQEGEVIGYFPLAELPIILPNFHGSGNNHDVVKICINDNPNCCRVREFEAPNCGGGECHIFDVVAEAHPCTPNGIFYVDIAFEFENVGNEGYKIQGNGHNYGTFSYNEPFPTLGPFTGDGETVYEFVIIDLANPNCSNHTVLGPIDCDVLPCEIHNLTVETLDCNNDGTYQIRIDFEVENPGNDFFEVFTHGGDLIGYFPLGDLPLTIEHFHPSGEPVDVIKVCINDHPDCCRFAEFEAPNCNGGDCHIFDVMVGAQPCNDDGGFFVEFSFEFDNVGNEGYKIVGNGNFYGEFSYNEPFPLLGPFIGDGETVYEFVVVDLQNPECSNFATLGPIHCGGNNCTITELEAVPHCNDNGTYNLFIDFEVISPGNDFFEAFNSNGEYLGFFPIADLPIGFENYQGTAVVETITICINDIPECCYTTEFETPNCNSFCSISEIEVDPLDCHGINTYSLWLNFQHEHTSGQGFDVFSGDDFIGFYGYEDLPVIVENFPQRLNSEYDIITICDNDNPNCCKTIEFMGLDCPNSGDCFIEDIIVEPNPCNDDGTFTAEWDFAFGNVGNEGYELRVDGEVYGHFDYSHRPTLGPFDGNGQLVHHITVTDLQHPNCSSSSEFESPNCNSFCSISEIEVDPLDCDGQNTYSLWLNFQHEHTSGQGFDVFSGDDFIGFYSYADLPVIVESFPQRLNSEYDIITICDNDNPNCCKTIEFMGEDCSTEFCLTFEHYANLEEPEILAEEGDSGLIIHQENGVDISATEIVFDNSNGFLQNISITPTQLCDAGFEAAEGVRLYMEGGIRLDFSSFAIKPSIVSFDYAYCPGTDFINLAFNNTEPFYGFFEEMPDVFHDIQVIVEPSNNVGTQGRVTLMGELESLLIGGIPLHIDNICFNGLPEDEEVWPGDGNSDNIAHHIDLLHVGLGFGTEGIQRDQLSISWEGIPTANWDSFFATGANYKHADCNGDGIINELDKGVIVQNYGLTHGNVGDHSELPGTDLDPPIFVDFSNADEWPTVSNFEVPIVLGSADLPLEDIYGIAFTVTVDPTIFNLNALGVEYSDSWFGAEGNNMLTIEKIYEEEGKIEIAMTRTNQQNVSGHGTIAYLVGIIDDIAGIRVDTKVDVTLIRAIDNDENLIALNNPTQNVRIVKKKAEEQPTVGRIDLRRGTTIFPNPAQNWIEVSNKYHLPITSLELFDAQGRSTGKKVNNDSKISLEGLPRGVYMLKYEVGKHIIHERIVKM